MLRAHRSLLPLSLLLPFASLPACGPVPGDEVPDGGLRPPVELRVPDRAVVAALDGADGAWWLEERLEGEPIYLGDHDLGPRSIVRAVPERDVVWTAPEGERLTDAVVHPSGAWSAVGVDDAFGVFLVRGAEHDVVARITLDDPELAADPWAWLQAPPDALRVRSSSESSVSIAADGEDVVVALVTEDLAAVLYRWRWDGAQFVRGARTLVSPAIADSGFLPIGGSYDVFEALASPYVLHLGLDATGRAFVALFVMRTRIERHDAALGTHLELLRDRLYPRENTSDVLVVGVDRDGTRAFDTIVGTPDVEDELFGLVVGERRIAVLGRSRRELGRDNTELHGMVAELDHAGAPLGTTTIDLDESGLVQAGAYDGDTLYVGGSEGWLQNPSGRSVYTEGRPFLVRLAGAGPRTVARLDGLVPPTTGHAELRALSCVGARLRLGGLERGPLTHTGDGDRTLIRSDAYWVERAIR